MSEIQEELKPIDILLFCPNCSKQHIDRPQPEKDWSNPPHKSHECQFCLWVWRPADVYTNGVSDIETKGQNDKSAYPRFYATEKDFENAISQRDQSRADHAWKYEPW